MSMCRQTLVSGVSGLSELSTINRAIGVLIDHGHHPDHAVETLRREASREGLEPLAAPPASRKGPSQTSERRQASTPAGCAAYRPPASSGGVPGRLQRRRTYGINDCNG